ncbi:uncharacterized protein METZ01_LOCUS318470 [marine metagenome]|uniref:Uncharacterized protein n=1 Tax=marine metagenome TaxID=408172 RepID=A0A382NX25_9ZZZZ
MSCILGLVLVGWVGGWIPVYQQTTGITTESKYVVA